MQPPPPPPPPPRSGGDAGPVQAMELPPHLQAMMREVQSTMGSQQDLGLPLQFGKTNAPRRDTGGGRGGGRGGRGRGGYSDRGRGESNHRGRGGYGRGGGGGGRGGFRPQEPSHYGQFKRPRNEGGDRGAGRFFMPSFLEDPWLALMTRAQAPTTSIHTQPPSQHQQAPPQQRPGRVLFQPSFLSDPWASLLR